MYYGIDCNTSVFPTGAPTHDFYIGRLGKGTNINSTYWNNTGASLATNRYGVWMLLGPQLDPNYNATSYSMADAMNWGKTQANYAIGAHIQKGLTTLTIFADIERKSEGDSNKWFENSGTNINWGVYIGFIDEIHVAGKKAGTYTGYYEWEPIMGLNNSPANYCDTFWQSHWIAPFDNPPSTLSGYQVIPGATPTILQYSGGTKDADIATSLPA